MPSPKNTGIALVSLRMGIARPPSAYKRGRAIISWTGCTRRGVLSPHHCAKEKHWFANAHHHDILAYFQVVIYIIVVTAHGHFAYLCT